MAMMAIMIMVVVMGMMIMGVMFVMMMFMNTVTMVMVSVVTHTRFGCLQPVSEHRHTQYHDNNPGYCAKPRI